MSIGYECAARWLIVLYARHSQLSQPKDQFRKQSFLRLDVVNVLKLKWQKASYGQTGLPVAQSDPINARALTTAVVLCSAITSRSAVRNTGSMGDGRIYNRKHSP